MAAFPFTIAATDGAARTGMLATPRGDIRTPAFMPVGTAGTVKALTVDQVRAAGADILLGNTYHLMLRPTAERPIEIQSDLLGSDIAMQLDELVAWPAEEAPARGAMERSVRWAARSKAAFGERQAQALFGIQQGSTFPALRRESAERLIEIGFDGYALGGLAVGEGHAAMVEVLDYAPAMLPADRPRYLMGVGKPIDLVE